MRKFNYLVVASDGDNILSAVPFHGETDLEAERKAKDYGRCWPYKVDLYCMSNEGELIRLWTVRREDPAKSAGPQKIDLGPDVTGVCMMFLVVCVSMFALIWWWM